jgi:drug/metabolite transporter (DMT)-like permease
MAYGPTSNRLGAGLARTFRRQRSLLRGPLLTLTIFLAVLAAAALHAVWNAMVKGGGDPLQSLTHMALAGLLFASFGLFFVAVPRAEAWPWLLLSVALHTGYRLALVQMYRLGDMGQVYPIARGSAPFLTALIAFAVIGESLGAFGYAGIALLGVGVALLSLKGGRQGGIDAKAAGAALFTSLWVSAYSFADGYGARVNLSGPSFALWLFFLNALVNIGFALLQRGASVVTSFPQHWRTASGAALMSQTAYFIAIWAMTQAPIALVAALRETSVLFAAAISVVFLREPLTRWRLAAALIIVVGAMLLRLG